MKLMIKLLARDPFEIQIQPNTHVRQVKEIMNDHLRIPIEEQRLIFQGMILQNNEQISNYTRINEGSKLHLIMVTKKRHPLYKKLYEMIRPHYSEKETQKILSIFMRRMYDSFRKLSLDDLERIARQELANDIITKPEKMIVD